MGDAFGPGLVVGCLPGQSIGQGYTFNWGEVFGVWRYIDYSFKSSSKVEDLTVNGPAIGVAFSW